jgi:hypothetical protein
VVKGAEAEGGLGVVTATSSVLGCNVSGCGAWFVLFDSIEGVNHPVYVLCFLR